MVKLTRTTEYALTALWHLTQSKETASISVKSICDRHGIPFEMTAKVLQRLKDAGLVHASVGKNGGYRLSLKAYEIDLGKFLEIVEGPQGVVPCLFEDSQNNCSYGARCEMKFLMHVLNKKVGNFLSQIQLMELLDYSKGKKHEDTHIS